MRKTLLIALSLTLTIAMVKAQAPATIRLTDVTLMHEMRETGIPEDKAIINDRSVSFQWPLLADLKTQDSELKALAAQAALKKADKTKLRYKIRWSQDATFKKGTMQAETRWPFFQSGTSFGTGHMALAIRLHNKWRNQMGACPTIYRKQKPGNVLSAGIENGTDQTTESSSARLYG